MQNPVREAHARIYLHTECGDFHCGEHECVTWSEDRLADTDIEYVRAPLYVEPPAPPVDKSANVQARAVDKSPVLQGQAEPPAPREPPLTMSMFANSAAYEAAAPSEIARDAARIPREPTEAMRQALRNVRLLAARHRKEEWAQHMLRFCAEAGETGSPLRDAAIEQEEK
jgi:hypothetical protein